MKKAVFITGASSGLGRLAAETVARAGHHVFAGMRQVDGRNAEAAASLKTLAAQESLKISVVELDVTSDGSAQSAVAAVMNEAGCLDVLVNNAGHMTIGLAEGFTEAQARQQMDVNFLGPFRLSRAVLPHMRAQRSGLLIHVTSIVGRVVFPGAALYCASKFAHEALAEALHYELAGTGVESVIVQPGPYSTHLLANSPGPEDAERLAGCGEIASLRETFIGMFGQLFASEASPNPQEVANAIAHLIDLPAGARPLRTVCGLDYGAAAINERVAPLQAEVLRALGMGHMVAAVATAASDS
jgi:NAD(P)-dependent dehydrogenase (short-subunit alcohol dehydrogenase family)